MSTTNMNGRVPRKTLANQLDRLDTILDGLADALNEAVADAVKQAVAVAVREAVQVAMQEVLTNPELLRALMAQTTPALAPTPKLLDVPEKRLSLAAGVKDRLRRGWEKVKTSAQLSCAFVSGKASSARKSIGRLGRRIWQRLTTALHLANRFRKPVSIAACVGLLVGAGSFFAGPVVAAVVSGLTSTGLTLAGSILLPFWQLLVPAAMPAEQG